MLLTACEQFLGKPKEEIHEIALHTLEGHQRAIMGSMTVEVCLFNNVYSFYINRIYEIEIMFVFINSGNL